MKIKKRVVIWTACLLGLLLPTDVFSQSDLQIGQIFEQFARKKNAIMVELSEDVLKPYNIRLYKSISVKNDASAVDFMRACIKIDQANAKKTKQVMKSGTLSSVYLQLPKRGIENRYILFRADEESSATLIYIETSIETDNIVSFLLKKNQQ